MTKVRTGFCLVIVVMVAALMFTWLHVNIIHLDNMLAQTAYNQSSEFLIAQHSDTTILVVRGSTGVYMIPIVLRALRIILPLMILFTPTYFILCKKLKARISTNGKMT